MSSDIYENNSYLGDGVYAEFDGYAIVLRTGSHRDNECDNRIYLEQKVMDNLDKFNTYIKVREQQKIIEKVLKG